MSSGPAQPVVLVIEPSVTDPVERLGEWLVDAGVSLDVRRAAEPGAIPADAEGIAGIVVMGGPMGANDDADYPWLGEVKALLRDAVSREVPTLGVCLGGQLLAAANGGRVERNPEGPEIGAQLVAKRSTAAQDPLFGPMPITPDVIQWHYDAITALPPGALQLASSPGADNQAFRLGRLAWGLQFHIETTPERVASWADSDPQLAEYDLTRVVERSTAAHDDIEETWRPFAAAFAEIVRDPSSVAPPRAVPTSSAAPITDPAAIRAALAAEVAGSRSTLPMPQLRRPEDDPSS